MAWLDATGAVKATFVYGLHVNVPEYMTTGGRNYRILTDHLGSPRLVVDAGSGAVVQRMDYDSFGNVRHSSDVISSLPSRGIEVRGVRRGACGQLV